MESPIPRMLSLSIPQESPTIYTLYYVAYNDVDMFSNNVGEGTAVRQPCTPTDVDNDGHEERRNISSSRNCCTTTKQITWQWLSTDVTV